MTEALSGPLGLILRLAISANPQEKTRRLPLGGFVWTQ